MTPKEHFRLTFENNQLKKKLKQAIADKERLDRDYRELAKFAMERDQLKKSS